MSAIEQKLDKLMKLMTDGFINLNRRLAIAEEKQKEHNEKIEKQVRILTKTMAASQLFSDFKLIKTMNDFELMDSELAETVYASAAQVAFKKIITQNGAALTNFLSDEILMSFNFSGRYPKKNFSATNFYDKVFLREYFLKDF